VKPIEFFEFNCFNLKPNLYDGGTVPKIIPYHQSPAAALLDADWLLHK